MQNGEEGEGDGTMKEKIAEDGRAEVENVVGIGEKEKEKEVRV